MKYLSLLLLLLISSCASKPIGTSNAITLTSECKKEGKCEITVHQNKSLVVSTSEYGQKQYKLEDSKSKKVVIFSYNRDIPKGVQDAQYKEEIIIEMDTNAKPGTFSDFSEKGTMALFGRFCYCKGYTGYYTIDDATLNLEEKDKMQLVNFNFKMKEVPQQWEHISFSIQ